MDTWIAHLKQEDPKFYPYDGNSYLGECTKEAFEFSSKFLLKIGPKLPNGEVIEAGRSYNSAAVKMAEFVRIFPFKMEGTMEKDKRSSGIKILTSVKEDISQAIDHLHNAVS